MMRRRSTHVQINMPHWKRRFVFPLIIFFRMNRKGRYFAFSLGCTTYTYTNTYTCISVKNHEFIYIYVDIKVEVEVDVYVDVTCMCL